MTTNGASMEVSPFGSIASSIYYTIVTLTTVGYGDVVPTSPGGRALASIMAYTGIAVLAMPIAVLSNNFVTEFKSLSDKIKKSEHDTTIRNARRRVYHTMLFVKSLKSKTASETSNEATSSEVALKDDSTRTPEKSPADIKEAEPSKVLPLTGKVHKVHSNIPEHIFEEAEHSARATCELIEAQAHLLQSHFSSVTHLREHCLHAAELLHLSHVATDSIQVDDLMSSSATTSDKNQSLTNGPNVEGGQSSKPRRTSIFSEKGHGPKGHDEAPTYLEMLHSSPLIHSILVWFQSTPWVPPEVYTYDVPEGFIPRKKKYHLNLIQRVFVAFEIQSSSILSTFLSVTTLSLVVIGVICYVAETQSFLQYTPTSCDSPACNNDPVLCPGTTICEPVPLPIFDTIDAVVVIYFTIDYCMRVFTCPFVPRRLASVISQTWDDDEEERAQRKGVVPEVEPRPLAWYNQLFFYMTTMSNMVDVVVVVPFYVSLSNASSVKLTFARVLRLTRVIRVMKLGKNSKHLNVVIKTMIMCGPTLVCLFFVVGMVIIIFAAVISILESGNFIVNSDYPFGQYLRPDVTGSGLEITMFTSIPDSIYWAIVTCTTVGYGDLFPTTVGGRAVGCLAAVCGIAILALPITVIGSTFSQVYDEMLDFERIKEEEAKRDRLDEIEDEKSSVRALPLKDVDFRLLSEESASVFEDADDDTSKTSLSERQLRAQLDHTRVLLKLLMDDYQLLSKKVKAMSEFYDVVTQSMTSLHKSANLTETEVQSLSESLAPVARLHEIKDKQSTPTKNSQETA